MPQLITFSNTLLRINTQKNILEYSTNNGRTWLVRYNGTTAGLFMDLLPYGPELLAITDKGLYYSANEGRTWLLRYNGSSCGTMQQLSVDGNRLLASTSKGLYYSTNSGRSWLKR